MKPAHYARKNKNWQKYLGKKGTVLSSTLIRVTSPELSYLTPYSYVLVDLGNEKKELMGVGNQILKVGDQVECVLRKISTASAESLIEYGIKAQKI
jgi:uncharacterized OB-fold protein